MDQKMSKCLPGSGGSSVGLRSDRRLRPASGTLTLTGRGFSLPFRILRSAANCFTGERARQLATGRGLK
jgi:hypothetical protein